MVGLDVGTDVVDLELGLRLLLDAVGSAGRYDLSIWKERLLS